MEIPSVLLVVPTFHRPVGLRKLLAAVAQLTVPDGVEFSVHVIDNSPAGTAAAALQPLCATYPHPLSIGHEPVQGLSRVRNAALDIGIARGCDWLAFIDDDEMPEPDWLVAHMRTLTSGKADASMGAVHADYQTQPPEWVRRGAFLEMRDYVDGAPMPFGATSNIIFSLAPVRRHDLRFDPAYDLTGGEDTAFFDTYIGKSAGIVFTSGAVVHETVPPVRASAAWLWQRWRRTGQTNGRIRLARRQGARARSICVLGGLARIGVGIVIGAAGLVASPFGRAALGGQGLRIIARGFGFVDASLDRHIREYADPTR